MHLLFSPSRAEFVTKLSVMQNLKFITANIKVSHWLPILTQLNPIQITKSHYFNIPSNIIRPFPPFYSNV
jgi:hypothetical protein